MGVSATRSKDRLHPFFAYVIMALHASEDQLQVALIDYTHTLELTNPIIARFFPSSVKRVDLARASQSSPYDNSLDSGLCDRVAMCFF